MPGILTMTSWSSFWVFFSVLGCAQKRTIRYSKLYKLCCKTSCLLLLAAQTAYLRKHETITLKNKTFIKCTSNLFQIISMHLNVKTWVVFYSWYAHRREKNRLEGFKTTALVSKYYFGQYTKTKPNNWK